MDFIKNTAKEIAGGVSAKAVLCIPYTKVPDLDKGDNSADGSKRLGMAQQRMMNLYSGSSAALKSVSSALTHGYATLQVDYNPSSISFSSQQEGTYTDKTMQSVGGGLLTLSKSSEVCMNVQLMFDDVSVQDAFMWDKFELSASGIGKSIANLAGGGHTVQVPIEGIIALIRHQVTRNVTFIWGETVFYGLLTSVGAKYTMFNPDGAPIRGTVDLSLIQNLQGDGNQSARYWDSAFDKMMHLQTSDDFKKLETDISAEELKGRIGNLIQF